MAWSKSKADERFDRKIDICQLILLIGMTAMAIAGQTHGLYLAGVCYLSLVGLEIRRDLMNIELELKELNFHMKLNNLNKNCNYYMYNSEIPK